MRLQPFWQFLRGSFRQPACSERRPSSLLLEVCQLEDRDVPSGLTLGTVSGVVNVLAVHPAALTAPGVQVRLTGTSDAGAVVDLTTTTDSTGSYAFRSVDAGSYQLTAAAGATFITGGGAVVAVTGGQNSNANLAVGGLTPGGISLRYFLTNTTSANAQIPFSPVGAIANSAPTVRQALADITLTSGGIQTFNAATGFADPDTTNSQLLFDTNNGNLRVDLFDAQAPQTVANFLAYVVHSRYDATIFHRLSSLTGAESGTGFDPTPLEVLQGGGFGLAADFAEVANEDEPTVANEFNASLPNSAGTIAMARLSEADSATSQFFINITDNAALDTSPGYAVFGSIASDAESQATFASLQEATSSDQSNTNGAFSNLPLKDYTGADNDVDFPGNTTSATFLLIEDVRVIKLDERLTFSIVSISDPTLLTVTPVSGRPEVFTITAATVSQTRTATVTVQATDQFGRSVQSSFTVTVDP